MEKHHSYVRHFPLIISDNRRQFNKKKGRELSEELGIKKHFSTPHNPQANHQIKAINKTIKYTFGKEYQYFERYIS